MASPDKDWLLVRSNIRRLMQAADDVAEEDSLPLALRRHYNDLEDVLRRIEQAIRRYEA